MNRQNRKRGFTMAEMLIVVAIIGVLGAVAFVAVNQHQRSLERLERDSVAREIFIAAQNHLTMAESQGYLGVTGENIFGKDDATQSVYYFAVNKGDAYSDTASPKTLLDLMLPFGSIDETVRGGGSYIIRYQPKSGLEVTTDIITNGIITDVFYCSTDDRFGYDLSGISPTDLSSMLKEYGEGKESARRNFNGKVLGWYGGKEAEALSRVELKDPEIDVENGDKLRVGINDNNSGTGTLQVILTGVTSKKVIKLFSNEDGFSIGAQDYKARLEKNKEVNGKVFKDVIILDDITTENLHFADLVADEGGPFIPGEDVKIQAIAFDNKQISNIGYSAEITVNSLYQSLQEGVADTEGNIPMVASIGSIRHLENLDKTVSNVEHKRTKDKNTYLLNNAVQTSDLSWKDFKTNTNAGTTGIVLYSSDVASTPSTTGAGNYLPVVTTNALTYDGKNHSVSDIVVNYAGDAGMFGKLISDSSVSNLQLVDFSITATTGNAGALVGTLEQTTALANDKFSVSNVLAYNRTSATTIKVSATAKANGHAGGLIGAMVGDAKKNTAGHGKVVKSAASLIVASTSGNAGGLVGTTTGGTVTACYSGGHISDAAYSKTDYNVTAGGNAGGLIGSASSTPIDYCYSTCSATGTTAGGLVGSCVGTIKHSYCTGLVKSTADTLVEGAFAGTWSGMTDDDGNYYLVITNEKEVKDESGNIIDYTDTDPVSGSKTIKGLSAIDESATSYNDFCGAQKTADEKAYLWKPAVPYEAKLVEYYAGRYNLKTVEQLGYGSVYAEDQKDGDGNITDYADFVIQHYGDWPAPEIFVINTAS